MQNQDLEPATDRITYPKFRCWILETSLSRKKYQVWITTVDGPSL